MALTLLAVAPTGLAGLLAATGTAPVAWSLVLVLSAVAVSIALITWLVTAPASAATALARRQATEMELLLNAERSANSVQDRLDRALPMCGSEADALRTAMRASGELLVDHRVELLLAQPGEARVAWRLPLGDGRPGDAVPMPDAPACAALARGGPVTSTRSDALDACGHVRDDRQATSSVCVPIRADDESIGALCVQGPIGDVPDEATLRRLEWIAQRVGSRVEELRAAHGPSGPGRPDPLTGLPTRLALWEQLRERLRSLTPFCVATIEIDGYDELPTDSDADEALRTVAEVLCNTLRPDDAIFRTDSGRFAAVLNSCDVDQAGGALERARELLVLEFAAGRTQLSLTFSAGVVASRSAQSLRELVELADCACDRAVVEGGNRVSAAD